MCVQTSKECTCTAEQWDPKCPLESFDRAVRTERAVYRQAVAKEMEARAVTERAAKRCRDAEGKLRHAFGRKLPGDKGSHIDQDDFEVKRKSKERNTRRKARERGR